MWAITVCLNPIRIGVCKWGNKLKQWNQLFSSKLYEIWKCQSILYKSCPVLRMIDQIVNPRQALLPEAEGWWQWWLSRVDNQIYHPQHRAWLFFITPKVNRSLTLFISVLEAHSKRVEHELVQGFSSNSLPCKQMTTLSPLLLVSAQLVNVPLFLQNEFAKKYR